jgi:hypothetical protein
VSWLARIAENKIQEAIERGEFSNLPFRGQAIDLTPPPFVPEDLRLAYGLLKTHGFVPPEIELKREIASLQQLVDTIQEEGQRLQLVRTLRERTLKLNLLLRR